MSESQTAKPAPPRSNPTKDAVTSLAGQIRHANTGTQARLRRSHPQQDHRAALFETEWMLQAAHVEAYGHDRWALLVHCLAIVRGAHAVSVATEPGRVLAEIRFSEARLRQLLEADADLLIDLLPRLARRLAAAGRVVNWHPLAELLLYTGTPLEDRADRARRRLVDWYLDIRGPSNVEVADAAP